MKGFIRTFLALFGAAGLTVLAIAGFRGDFTQRTPIEIFPDMDHQPKYKSQTPASLFPEGRVDRVPPYGTIPFHVSTDQPYLITGKMGNMWGTGIPVTVDKNLLVRGKERYEINCQVCHGALGAGNGVTTQYGLVGVASIHLDKYRDMADGEIFNTITHGKGQMGPYHHIQVEDRWAIIAYLRALQFSQNAPADLLPPDFAKAGSP
ncbi:MAG: c-type cytochrome [Candidatus Methylacidiphilales bacterium]|jgi:mono/diheme cytochrome c family protein